MDILSHTDFEYNRLIEPIIYEDNEELQTDNFGINRMGHIFYSFLERDLWLQRQTNTYASPKIGVQHRTIAISSAPYNQKVYLESSIEYSNLLNAYINYTPHGVFYQRELNSPNPPSGTILNNFKFWMRTNIAVEFVLPVTNNIFGTVSCALFADFYDAENNIKSTKRLDGYNLSFFNIQHGQYIMFPHLIMLQGDIIYPLEPNEYVNFYIDNAMPFPTLPSLQGYMEHQELSEENVLTQVL